MIASKRQGHSARFSLGLSVVLSIFFWVPQAFAQNKASTPFRLHIPKEPTSLDPHLQNSSGASYALHNLFRNLFWYDTEKGLVPDLAQSCNRHSRLILTCKLKPGLKWSDGSTLSAKDFLASYQRILDPKSAAPRADQLFKVKNAKAIFQGKKKIEALGIQAMNATTLRFEFEEADSEFEYSLSSYLLAPVKISENGAAAKDLQKSFTIASIKTLATSGPYKVESWQAGQKLVLTSNAFYDGGKNAARPNVEILFIPEDSVALQLYEKGTLSFLRRLPTLYIPAYKSRTDFLWIPLIRFDYLGFGPALRDQPSLREALAYSLRYKELQKIFSSEGVPGCPGIPLAWQKKELCYEFDLKRAKAALQKSSEGSGTNKGKPLQFVFSVFGGDDHRRTAEWLQSQWKTNLGLSVETSSKDNKVFLAELGTNPPAIFRKGATPDRPTCLAALETFALNSPENYLDLKDPSYAEILKKLAEATSTSKKKALCSDGIEFLISRHLLIPTGPIHFAMLIKKDFSGWKINDLNQLDLAGLKEQTKK